MEKPLSDKISELSRQKNTSKSNVLRMLVEMGLKHAVVRNSFDNHILSIGIQNLVLSKKLLSHFSEEKLHEARLESKALIDEVLEGLKK